MYLDTEKLQFQDVFKLDHDPYTENPLPDISQEVISFLPFKNVCQSTFTFAP